MHNHPPTTADHQSWKQLIVQTRATWLTTTLLCGAAAFVLSLASARHWEAVQAVVVRQDAVASRERPGKFADLYEMRTVQETILELARSRQVVASTVAAVDGVDPQMLTAEDLDEFRSRMRMTPPGGAEFGKTELFYLSVEDADRHRALGLVGKLCEQLDRRLRDLRAEQARGMIAEIVGQLAAAKESLSAETAKLAEFEAQIGADLGELRMLHSAWSGQSDLRQRYVDLGSDLRRAQQAVQESERLLELLATSADDPNQLASLPNSLISAQPTLRRLKDGLVDAQLRTSRLQGARSAEHPRVVAAVEAEASMRRDLVQEIIAARHAAEAELHLRKSRLEAAAEQLRSMEQRLARLAEQRAQYSNLVASSESSQASVDQLRSRLAEAEALLAATETSSVLNLVDSPETGPSPNGPSRAVMLLAGLLGGLTIGAGLVFYQQAPEVAYVATAEHSASAPDANRSPTASPVEDLHPVEEWWELSGASHDQEMKQAEVTGYAPQREDTTVPQTQTSTPAASPFAATASIDSSVREAPSVEEPASENDWAVEAVEPPPERDPVVESNGEQAEETSDHLDSAELEAIREAFLPTR